MALATYSDLQASIEAFLNRKDLSGVIPDFIALFEVRARRELKDWLHMTLTAAAVTGDYVLPATVSEVIGVSNNDGVSGAHNFALDIISRQQYQDLLEVNANVQPPPQACFPDFDRNANTYILRFWPPLSNTATANLRIDTAKVLPSLSGSQTTNELLADAPDAYLYGALAESAPYLQHDERLPMWEKRAAEAIRGLRILTQRRLHQGIPQDLPQPIFF